jgi:carbamoyltransferase
MPRYIQNHNRIFAPYMCITFDSTQEARRDLKAALHPKDSTVRPQCVIKDWNPDYHEIISEFKKLTGIGGVLNTSFNLHGEPNVCSPADAIYTLDNSGLNYLAMGRYLLSKRASL